MSSRLRPRWGWAYGASASRQKGPPGRGRPPGGATGDALSFIVLRSSLVAASTGWRPERFPGYPAHGEQTPPARTGRRRRSRSSRRRRLLLEHQPIVVQQLPLEADAVGADARGEREPEIGAREPARQKLELEQRLPEARGRKALVPLADRFGAIRAGRSHSTRRGSAARRTACLAARARASTPIVASRARCPTKPLIASGPPSASMRAARLPPAWNANVDTFGVVGPTARLGHGQSPGRSRVERSSLWQMKAQARCMPASCSSGRSQRTPRGRNWCSQLRFSR
jgi:hypothetical protein